MSFDIVMPQRSVEERRAELAAARAQLTRQAFGWGAVAVTALAISIWAFQSAQAAAESGNGSTSYVVLWGPVVFGGWRAIQAAMAAARLAEEERDLR